MNRWKEETAALVAGLERIRSRGGAAPVGMRVTVPPEFSLDAVTALLRRMLSARGLEHVELETLVGGGVLRITRLEFPAGTTR